jgi:hypothetical protein
MVHTYCHHNANGYSTWTQVLKGFKIFVEICPDGFLGFKTRRDFWESCGDFLKDSPDDKRFYGNGSERAVIYAEPGDIM